MTNIDPSALVGAMHGPKIVVPTSLIMHLGLESRRLSPADSLPNRPLQEIIRVAHSTPDWTTL